MSDAASRLPCIKLTQCYNEYVVMLEKTQNVCCSNIYVTNVLFENDPFGLLLSF